MLRHGVLLKVLAVQACHCEPKAKQSMVAKSWIATGLKALAMTVVMFVSIYGILNNWRQCEAIC